MEKEKIHWVPELGCWDSSTVRSEDHGEAAVHLQHMKEDHGNAEMYLRPMEETHTRAGGCLKEDCEPMGADVCWKYNTAKRKESRRFLECVEENLLTQLICQQSWLSGEVPIDWRLANAMPIYKKGQKEDPGNYRPLSITLLLGKVIEQIILSAIMSDATR
ncbi:hypothetical protein TURU_065624 [Turdus rufiventris]|nr:hypothetical protein TURU_065624 [Turdus rufiventris]